jgi:predicted small integral membrane protein
MIVRISKCLLVLSIAFFYTLVVLNNTTDYNSNYQFVRHVLQMDTTFPGNRGMGRAIHSTTIHRAFYVSVICWEALTGALLWWGGVRLALAVRGSAVEFGRAKAVSVAGLTLGMLLWLVAFLSVGGEWFLMWQSKAWNGQDAAFRLFVILGIVLLYVTAAEVIEHE